MCEEKKHRKKGCLITAAVVILMPIILFGSCQLKTYLKTKKIGEQVVKILDKKYNRNFAVKSGRYIWNLDCYEFRVYPENEPDFGFQAWSGLFAEPESIRDTYLLVNQSATVRKWVLPYIKEISNNYYIDYTNPDTGGNDIILSDMHKKRLELSELLKKYPNQISVSICFYFNLAVTDKNKEKIFKATYDLIEFLKMKKFGSVFIYFGFFDLSNKNINKIFAEIEYDSKIYFKYNKYLKNGISIKPKELPDIKNYKDIEKCFLNYSKNKNGD